VNPLSFEDAVARIVKRDPRYSEDAYAFLREALDFTVKLLEKPAQGPTRHVSGQELLEGIRRYALREYGQMAQRVLAHWGVRSSEDFGEIVFNLVETGVLGRTESDQRADFANGYDFTEAFRAPFRPGPDPAPPGRGRVPAGDAPGAEQEEQDDG
jgi:uncharacterized repeat protein (TIGR04138 family)